MNSRIKYAGRAACLTLALLHAWWTQFVLDPDGMAYMDIARAWLRGDWQHALNPYWSPLYPWLLAACVAVFHPAIQWEMQIGHFVNLAGFAAVLFSWEWLLKEWEEWQGAPRHPALAATAGYGVVAWSAIHLEALEFTSADIFVIAILLSMAALLVRFRAGRGGVREAVWLGTLAALGYFAKTAFAGEAVAVVACLAAVSPAARRWRWCLVAGGTAVALTAPFVLALSVANGRFTAGDSGWLNYSWQVSGYGIPGYKDSAHPPPPDTPHPIRVVMESPLVQSFDQHMVGTIPVHADPAWWSAGYPVELDVARQLMILADGLVVAAFVFASCPALVLAVAYIVLGDTRETLKGMGRLWYLWLPALALTGSYCLVFVLGRYLAAPYALLGFAGIASVWKIQLRRWAAFAAAALLLPAIVLGLLNDLETARHSIGQISTDVALPRSDTPKIALEMRKRGFQAGDQVAFIGFSLNAAWLQLDRGQMAMAIPTRFYNDDRRFDRLQMLSFRESDRFWRSAPDERTHVLDLFYGLGAKWAVAYPVPVWADTAGWEVTKGDPGVFTNREFRPGVYVRRLRP